MYLQINNLHKHFETRNGTLVVLKDINMVIQQGEFICAVGASGSGKSTLLRQIAGLDLPTSGEVLIDGKRVTGPGPDRGMVFQHYTLYPWMNVQRNAEFGLKLQGVPPAQRRELASYYLNVVGLAQFARSLPKELSGGMKQRVAIARALAIRPEVLILDEPLGAHDPITKEELQEELLAIWREHRTTVLMITHDIDEALFLADRVVMMPNGPAATIGEILDIPFARPRNRARIMDDPRYYELRNEALDFLYRRFAHDDDA
jgi:nitrate ABC transporter ATP-binding subunit